MIRYGVVRMLLAGALVISAPGAAIAQDEPGGPDDTRWDLTSYAVDGELVAVPWTVDATLLLESGAATGNNGCNQFSGSYVLEGEVLTFGDAFTMTQKACTEAAASVEGGYMGNLPMSATWAIAEGVLQLSDDTGNVVLEFAEPVIGLTPNDIAALVATFEGQQAELDRLRERLDNTRVGTLRDRIKALEAETKQLQSQVATLRAAAGNSGSTAAFNAAEKILLEGIPAAIRKTCSPRRSQNPSGTLAAVQCQPNTPVVRDMAYYLMKGTDAVGVWEQRMSENGVTDGNTQCWNGKPSLRYYTPGPDVDGCYVNADGRANVRAVMAAAGCNQLKVDGKWVKTPAIYVALLGNDSNITKLQRWAWPKRVGDDVITKTIKRPNAPISPRCPS